MVNQWFDILPKSYIYDKASDPSGAFSVCLKAGSHREDCERLEA